MKNFQFEIMENDFYAKGEKRNGKIYLFAVRGKGLNLFEKIRKSIDRKEKGM